ncbi:MAG: TonB-dependent receptor [Cyclobacteriaceae bacterium]
MFVGKIDYQYDPSPKLKFREWCKICSHPLLDNNVLVTRFENNQWITDTKYTSYSSMSEQVAAAYSSVSMKLNNNIQFSGGLRYEYTHTSISTPTQKDLINRKYGYLFPSLFLKRELSQEKDIQFSYSRRITRPTYNDIAPFVFFWGPNTFSAGNTSLWPSISDAIQLSYRYKQWITSVQFSHSQRGKSVFFNRKEKVEQATPFIAHKICAISTRYPFLLRTHFSVANWWEIQINLSARYQVTETSHLPENFTLTIYGQC